MILELKIKIKLVNSCLACHKHSKNVEHYIFCTFQLCIIYCTFRQLVDFGFARKIDTSDVRVMVGTPEFVSPEVICYESISLTTDMWSVGVLTYVLLSGILMNNILILKKERFIQQCFWFFIGLSPFLGENNQVNFIIQGAEA